MTGNSVLVIGGGIAGLTATVELARNGVRPTLIEARDRLVDAFTPFTVITHPSNLGQVHSRNQVQTLGHSPGCQLATNEVSEQNQLLTNGTLHEVDVWKQVSEVLAKVDLKQADQSFREFLNTQQLPPHWRNSRQLRRRFRRRRHDQDKLACTSLCRMGRGRRRPIPISHRQWLCGTSRLPCH
jgi:choline dehydrogenase-like flavoprotein